MSKDPVNGSAFLLRKFDRRFGAQEGRKYSVGALYLCFLDLPRAIRYKRSYIALTIIIPGPKEPSLLQLNHVLRPFADDFVEFGKGE